MPSTGESLNLEQLATAAELRFAKRKSWEHICKQIATSQATLRAVRQTDRWKDAAAPWEALLDDIRRDSFIELDRLIREGFWPAIKEGLDRSEGEPTKNLNLKLSGGVNVNDERMRNLAGEFADRLAEVVPGEPSAHAD